MNNFEIKEFNSKDFNYSNLQNFLPLYNAYVKIAVDENENVVMEDLLKPLPNKNDKDFAKIACIKDIDELISDNSRCFVLFVDDKPVSFTLFSKDDNLAKYHLELVYTAKQQKNKGYAKQLLTSAFKILSEDAFCVSATVNSQNYASQALNSSLDFPFSTQEQSVLNDKDEQQTLIYYYHIINKEMFNFINQKAQKEQGIVHLSNMVGNEEFKALKNLMQSQRENIKEKE